MPRGNGEDAHPPSDRRPPVDGAGQRPRGRRGVDDRCPMRCERCSGPRSVRQWRSPMSRARGNEADASWPDVAWWAHSASFSWLSSSQREASRGSPRTTSDRERSQGASEAGSVAPRSAVPVTCPRGPAPRILRPTFLTSSRHRGTSPRSCSDTHSGLADTTAAPTRSSGSSASRETTGHSGSQVIARTADTTWRRLRFPQTPRPVRSTRPSSTSRCRDAGASPSPGTGTAPPSGSGTGEGGAVRGSDHS